MKLEFIFPSSVHFMAAICFASVPALHAALPLVDDFDDGNDDGWTRYDPLSVVGAGGTWSFPSGGYQIQTAASSPDIVNFGPARAGSLRTDEVITDAVLSWDVVNWDSALVSQVFGGIARVSDVGLGSTDSYALVYGNNSLDILRLQDEGIAASIAASPITLNVANDYRFVFTLNGSNLQGQVFDLAVPAIPLLTIGGTDATYASGVTGLLVSESSGVVNGSGDATFDNYSLANIPEPSGSLLAMLGLTVFLRRRR